MRSIKRKVLIIDNSSGKTGALNSIQAFARNIENVDFYLISQIKSNGGLKGQNFVKGFYMPFIEIQRSLTTIFYLPYLIINTVRLNQIVKKYKIDIVHVNDMYNMLGVCLKLLFPKTKVVYHIRLLPDSYISQLYNFFLQRIKHNSDAIIVVSQSVEAMIDYPVSVIYDAIEPIPVRQRNEAINELRLLYLANYTKGKGHDLAIEAMRLASNRLPNLKMVMYGSTFNNNKNQKYKTELGRLVNELDLADKVELNNFAEDKEQIFSGADIFLNFSNSESFSMTTLEALAYGTPAIVTDCGGPAEIIEDGISGKLVPVGDITAMAEAIVELANDPQRRERFSENGRKRCREKFSLEEQAKKLAAVYSSLLPTATSPPWHEAQGSAS